MAEPYIRLRAIHHLEKGHIVILAAGTGNPYVTLFQELDRYLPFLATTTLLMESVRRGAGREQVHEAIKEHAVTVALAMREGELDHNDLAHRLGEDSRVPLSESEIVATLSKSRDFVGLATDQVEQFAKQVQELVDLYPQSQAVEMGRLL